MMMRMMTMRMGMIKNHDDDDGTFGYIFLILTAATIITSIIIITIDGARRKLS
jgi:hypothetical protein